MEVVTGDLSSVEVKIRRAKTHLAELKARTDEISVACRKAIVHDRDDQSREHIFRLDPVPQIGADISAIAGDVIHNLRAALDYLAGQLVLASGNVPMTGPGGTSFPILETQKNGELPQIKPGVSEPIRRCLDEVQPYKRDPNPPANHDLAALHQLDIADKHQQLVIVVLGIPPIGWWGDDVKVTSLNRGLSTDGDEIARFAIPDGREEFNPLFSFPVLLNEPGAGALGRALGVADFLRDGPAKYIEREVLTRFRPFL